MSWAEISFVSKGKVTCGTITCSNWLTESLHHIGAAIYTPIADAIDAALDSNPSEDIIGKFYTNNNGVNKVCVHITIYLPAPYMGMFLKQDLTPAEAWSRL